MAISDFKLRYIQQKLSLSRERIHVLLQFKNSISAIEGAEFQVTSVAGDVAAGLIPINRLERLLAIPDIISVEAGHSLKGEMDASLVAINLLDQATQLRTIPSQGKGAIIGIIDSEFDLTHPCFCDAQGKTRILAAWDQVNLLNAQGAAPSNFDYGAEYTQGMVNQFLSDRKIVVIKNSPEAGTHGTPVAGIAAGNGAPDGVFAGVAPEAELILVAHKNDVPIGGSPFVLDAMRYILSKARFFDKPVVINLSQGDNLGAHDGTGLLERAIDNLVEQEGVVIVCSAGNSRGGKRHAQGRVMLGGFYSLPFHLNIAGTKVVDGDAIDLWYHRGDRFAVKLKSPDGTESQLIQPDATETVTFPTGAQAYISSETNCPGNGDNRIGIILEKGGEWATGQWELLLWGNEVSQGDFHAWADRPNATTVISFPEASDDCTVTLPATARRAITVSGFVSRPMAGAVEGDVQGNLQPLTSLGPTRDGRLKPDLTAPGFTITAPGIHKEGSNNPMSYAPRTGTSMAAPHISGVVALMLALNRHLTPEQIRAALYSTSSFDSFTGKTPNKKWGRGKVDAAAAYHAISKKDGGKTMPSDVIIKVNLSAPSEVNEGTSVSVLVEIEIKDGNIVSIKGTGEGKEYTGNLTLKRVSNAEGGDECIVCNPTCQEVSPCPTSPGTT